MAAPPAHDESHLCPFYPSASIYYNMLIFISMTDCEHIERRLYITASLHQTELVYPDWRITVKIKYHIACEK